MAADGAKERVLIAGGAGFIGSHMSMFLRKQGYWVRCVDWAENEFMEPAEYMLRFFLYEIDPDQERVKFEKEFAAAVARAAKLAFAGVKRRYAIVSLVLCDEPPRGWKPPAEKEKKPQRKPAPAGFSIAEMFKPPRDFIADTKHIRR
jgi:nucleoside-diphosphate-sugar epimerase